MHVGKYRYIAWGVKGRCIRSSHPLTLASLIIPSYLDTQLRSPNISDKSQNARPSSASVNLAWPLDQAMLRMICMGACFLTDHQRHTSYRFRLSIDIASSSPWQCLAVDPMCMKKASLSSNFTFFKSTFPSCKDILINVWLLNEITSTNDHVSTHKEKYRFLRILLALSDPEMQC